MIISKLVFKRDLKSSSIKNLQHDSIFAKPSKPKSSIFSWIWRGGDSTVQVVQEVKREEVKMEESKVNVTVATEVEKFKLKQLEDNSTKTLRPTSDQLKALNLKKGRNTITFSVTSKYWRGTQTVSCNLYFWDSNTKVVLSDIDGTITKSDLLGHVMIPLGRDWSHVGVTKLFTKIKENGYEIVYLTSRPIGQSRQTKSYLTTLEQQHVMNGKELESTKLPDGPVFMSPDRLLISITREMILRKPHEFKISCLRDFKNVFPHTCDPFYAGFGNRHTDAIAYDAVGIPSGKIFIINSKGYVSTANKTYSKTYTNLSDLVNEMFPMKKAHISETFNTWNYWKTPITNLK